MDLVISTMWECSHPQFEVRPTNDANEFAFAQNFLEERTNIFGYAQQWKSGIIVGVWTGGQLAAAGLIVFRKSATTEIVLAASAIPGMSAVECLYEVSAENFRRLGFKRMARQKLKKIKIRFKRSNIDAYFTRSQKS